MYGVHSNRAEPGREPWWQRVGAVPWLVVLARLVVGGIFVFAGMSKLALPHAEVVAQIQQYTVIPRLLTPLIAAVLPWVEVLSGAALLIGFEIEDCGCFGDLGWKETPLHVLLRDLVMLALMWPVLSRDRDVWAVDGWGLGSGADEQTAEATRVEDGEV